MHSRPTESPLLTTSQAADLLGLAPQTLHNWRVTGRGPAFIKVAGAVRYDVADLRAFLDERRHGQSRASGCVETASFSEAVREERPRKLTKIT